MPNWGEIKQTLRAKLWPQGEQVNLVGIHDTYFLDAMIDLQTYDECLKQDHTALFPACATYFDCGLTVFNKPAHSQINRLSVADRTDPVTHHEDPAADIRFCNAIEYHQTEATYLQRYRQCHHRTRTITPALFFGICGHRVKRCYPRPTDAGLPAGLPPLDMGLHYAQTSTDARRRSPSGVWAIERGKIYLAPWIQSSEVVIVKWDGVDMQMPDNKPMDSDFLLFRALRAWVRWRHAYEWDHEPETAAEAREEYLEARKELIERCIRETMVRERQPSQAQSSPLTLSVLYWNDQPASAMATADTSDCPAGQVAAASTTGQADIPAGSVSSPSSVSDANELAQAQAEEQAKALAMSKLVCYVPSGGTGGGGGGSGGGGGTGGGGTGGGGDGGGTGGGGAGGTPPTCVTRLNPDQTGKTVPAGCFGNDANRTVFLTCAELVSDTGAPQPTGNPNSTTPGGSINLTPAANFFVGPSVADANAAADAWAKQQLGPQLYCLWYNSNRTAQITCPVGSPLAGQQKANNPNNPNVGGAGAVGTRYFPATADQAILAQNTANQLAQNDAEADANSRCGGGMVSSVGTSGTAPFSVIVLQGPTVGQQCAGSVTVNVAPGHSQVANTGDFNADTQKATGLAQNDASQIAFTLAVGLAARARTGDQTACGDHTVNMP
jgi:hypothetical protein